MMGFGWVCLWWLSICLIVKAFDYLMHGESDE